LYRQQCGSAGDETAEPRHNRIFLHASSPAIVSRAARSSRSISARTGLQLQLSPLLDHRSTHSSEFVALTSKADREDIPLATNATMSRQLRRGPRCTMTSAGRRKLTALSRGSGQRETKTATLCLVTAQIRFIDRRWGNCADYYLADGRKRLAAPAASRLWPELRANRATT
jgi:hypothetical protein